MIKFILIILFSLIIILKNKIIFFYYNLLFFLRLLFFFIICDYGIIRNLRIYIGIDCYSYILILLRFWVIRLIYISLEKRDLLKKIIFMIILIILFLFFSIKNLLLFYFFFELRLIPTFILIIYWGYNPERLRASYFILIYTLLISLPLLIYIVKLNNLYCSFDFTLLILGNYTIRFWEFIILIGAFLIKIPIYLFHIWLPKAHVEAPVYGSMVLAAILLKLGRYGLIRILIVFLEGIVIYRNLIVRIGIIGRLVVRLICLIQIDIKRLVAYSSVVHINLILCGLIRFFKIGYIRAYLIIVAHGLCSSGLFYIVNSYYYRSSRRLLIFNKGIINILPSFVVWWFMLCASNFSFPLSIRFIGEIYFLGVLIRWNLSILIYLILIGFLRRAYSLYLFLYVQHGELRYIRKFNRGRRKELIVIILHYLPLFLILLNLILF